ncbi:hypothetical protein ABE073_19450 [Lederbergia citrisecunda]|uniref:hypothetical protein n=1 Tax=Lederbergia citrisecunda TaxID=2833583 RepID=UPI003D2DDEB5
MISDPDTISRDFVYERNAEDLYKEVNELVISTIKEAKPSTRYRRNDLKHAIRKAEDIACPPFFSPLSPIQTHNDQQIYYTAILLVPNGLPA